MIDKLQKLTSRDRKSCISWARNQIKAFAWMWRETRSSFPCTASTGYFLFATQPPSVWVSVRISYPLQAQVDWSQSIFPESFLAGTSRHLPPVLCSQCHKGSTGSHCQCSTVTTQGALNHTGRRGAKNAVNRTTTIWANWLCRDLFLEPKPKAD